MNWRDSDSNAGVSAPCVQSLVSLSAVMDWWKLEKSVTVATVTSVRTPAVTVPMKSRAKSANSSLAKSAGQM